MSRAGRPTWPINPIPRDIKLGLKVLHVMNHREANFSATGLNCLETENEDTGLSNRGSLLKELCLKAPIHRVNSMGLGSAEKDRLIKCKIIHRQRSIKLAPNRPSVTDLGPRISV